MNTSRMLRFAPAMLAAGLVLPGLAFAQGTTAPTTPAPSAAAPTTTPPGRESQAPSTTGMPARPVQAAPTQANPAHRAAAGRAATKPTDRVEGRIAELHKQLRITPAQAPQWDAFAQVMRDNARGMDASFDTRVSGREKMNAVENMQSYATLADQHAKDLGRLAPAFAAVYATMSDEQKRNADQVFRSQRGAAGRGR